MVSEWYRDFYDKKQILEKSRNDILNYEKLLKKRL